jgi:hypothetical protein
VHFLLNNKHHICCIISKISKPIERGIIKISGSKGKLGFLSLQLSQGDKGEKNNKEKAKE